MDETTLTYTYVKRRKEGHLVEEVTVSTERGTTEGRKESLWRASDRQSITTLLMPHESSRGPKK